MSGRVYSVPFNATSLGTTSGGVDLFAVTSSSTIPISIEEIRLDPCATSVSEFSLSLRRFTSTYTAGSGGSSVTPVTRVVNDAAAGATAKIMNTTKTATGTGTNTVLDAGQWNLVNGWAWQPLDPDHRIIVGVSSAVVLQLDTTPASQTVSGCLIFRELI